MIEYVVFNLCEVGSLRLENVNAKRRVCHKLKSTFKKDEDLA